MTDTDQERLTEQTKTCPVCAKQFVQGRAPKAAQVYCSYWCHLEAKGVLAR